MTKKPKKPQAESPNEVSERDGFQTPNYAVDLLVPFIPQGTVRIWECAAGEMKISRRLGYFGFNTYSTDLCYPNKTNFLTDMLPEGSWFDAIVTNPPFSIKKKFYKRCLWYQHPFALLLPAEYSGWLIEAVERDGCEKIIPFRRIDYITPRTLQRIWEGETWEFLKAEQEFETMQEYKSEYPTMWSVHLKECEKFHFKSIYDAPSELLRKYSSSYYHSMWLTWGFGIGKSETFVELTNEQKNNI